MTVTPRGVFEGYTLTHRELTLLVRTLHRTTIFSDTETARLATPGLGPLLHTLGQHLALLDEESRGPLPGGARRAGRWMMLVLQAASVWFITCLVLSYAALRALLALPGQETEVLTGLPRLLGIALVCLIVLAGLALGCALLLRRRLAVRRFVRARIPLRQPLSAVDLAALVLVPYTLSNYLLAALAETAAKAGLSPQNDSVPLQVAGVAAAVFFVMLSLARLMSVVQMSNHGGSEKGIWSRGALAIASRMTSGAFIAFMAYSVEAIALAEDRNWRLEVLIGVVVAFFVALFSLEQVQRKRLGRLFAASPRVDFTWQSRSPSTISV